MGMREVNKVGSSDQSKNKGFHRKQDVCNACQHAAMKIGIVKYILTVCLIIYFF